ncbi:MAG: CinA family protein [Clostridia bacterium]|nr:CinA family protein [Clostridia bacterium]
MNDTAARTVRALIAKDRKISFAESCTGGLACARLVDVPDASKVLDASFVTYANEAKIGLLGVKEETLALHGAVSEETAFQMAEGICRANRSHVGVGISGIAGPGGGTEEKPVGTVCFGFCIDGKTFTATQHFGPLGRQEVRKAAVDFVFETLCEKLEEAL